MAGGDTLKALSVRQPQAALLVLGEKRIETRPRRTSFRGLVAIHASLSFPLADRQRCRWHPFSWPLHEAGYRDSGELPRGAIVGVVELYLCREIVTPDDCPLEPELSFGDYALGRFAWDVRNPRALKTPVPCRGQLGLWTVPRDVEAAIYEQLPEVA